MKSFHFSIFLIILCGLAIWQATLIPTSGLVDAVGAKNFPFIIVILFVTFCIIYFFRELSFFNREKSSKKVSTKNGKNGFCFFNLTKGLISLTRTLITT